MQIHELNNFNGTPGSTNYLAIDNGSDTSRISGTDLLAPVNARIDNVVLQNKSESVNLFAGSINVGGGTYSLSESAANFDFLEFVFNFNGATVQTARVRPNADILISVPGFNATNSPSEVDITRLSVSINGANFTVARAYNWSWDGNSGANSNTTPAWAWASSLAIEVYGIRYAQLDSTEVTDLRTAHDGTVYQTARAAREADYNALETEITDTNTDLIKKTIYQFGTVLEIDSGYWTIADGTPGTGVYWCKSNYFVPLNAVFQTSSIDMYLLAFNKKTKAYIGGWDGSAFTTTFNEDLHIKHIDIAEWRELYPNYIFKIDFHSTTQKLTPSIVLSELTVSDAIDGHLEEIDGTLEIVSDAAFNKLEGTNLFEQGYWAVTNGGGSGAADWIRTPKYLGDAIKEIRNDSNLLMYLQAWQTSGTYVGTWNGSSFSKTYLAGTGLHTIHLEKFRENYPNYVFTLSAIVATGQAITPASEGPNVKFWFERNDELLNNLENTVFEKTHSATFFESGYWAIAGGGGSGATDWMRTPKFISDNIATVSNETNLLMYLQAWEKSNGAYVGTWDGSAFGTTYIPVAGQHFISLAYFRNTYPNYVFTISAKDLTGKTLYPSVDGKLVELWASNASSNENISPNYFIYSVNHRGYSTQAPENTLPAYILSKKKGFTYAECDVQFTSDEIAVLLHDDTINRTARNANGSDISTTINIGDITYQQALTYDFGIWKGSQWAGTKIPTFDEFINTCKQLSLHPFIELKDVVGGTYWTDARIKKIADSIKKVGMEENVSFISFSISALTKISTHFPKARLGLGYEGNYTEAAFRSFVSNAQTLLAEDREVIATVSYSQMNDTLYDILAYAGINPLIWTVNSLSAVRAMDETVVGVLSDSLNAGKILLDDLLATV